MKKLILIFAFISAATNIFSQFSIGNTTITFNDPSRTGGFGSGGGPGRQIQCEIYYPANSTGTSVPLASGTFPIIVFGHGFVMSWDAYQNIWEELVPEGYIMVFPRTEGSFSPSHSDFGLDLALVEQKMQGLGVLSSSIFYSHVSNRSAIMGHSMGGGATILAANSNTNIKTIVCLAPAETTPSAIDAAGNVMVPSLILSGTNDGVTPPIDHHIPIYDSIQNVCKTLINITGGGHCYFANSNLNCDFGEATSSTGISISRNEQQDISQDLYLLWFNYYLKQICNNHTLFLDSLAQSNRFTHEMECSYSSISLAGIVLPSTTGTNGSIDVSVSGGQAPYNYSWSSGQTTEDISGLSPGTYSITVVDDYGCTSNQTFFVSGSTGIFDNLYNVSISIFPNPSNSSFTLNSNINQFVTIKILAIDGKEINMVSNAKNKTVFGNDLTSGTYIIQIIDTNGMLLNTMRIVKL